MVPLAQPEPECPEEPPAIAGDTNNPAPIHDRPIHTIGDCGRLGGFSERVFADGALPAKTKQLIAVAAAHITQCPYCIRGHTRAALRHGATREEIMEAIWVAAEMRGGGVCAHSLIALAALEEAAPVRSSA